MSTLPAKYAWLAREGAPKMLVEMLKLYGTTEVLGARDNPAILGWAREIGVPYAHDSIAWCGLTVAVAAHRSKYDHKPLGNPLWARNWATWGTTQKVAMLGDVLVFARPGGGGHVGIYVGEDATHYHVLGGNQGDKVSIARKPKVSKTTPLLAIRRSDWKLGQPANVRVVHLSAAGTPTSTKED